MKIPFTTRKFDPSHPEMMDQAKMHLGKPSPELERDLANLRWLNRHFGAISLLHFFLKRWFSNYSEHSLPLRILDLATGEGDLPREIVLWCRARKISVEIDAVDLNTATLAVAQGCSRNFPEIHFHNGDIRSWGSESYDLVICSLALHHFSKEDALLVLRNALNLSSRHLLVTDLERSFLGAFGIWLLTTFLLREPMTVHDARLSIRRAFSFREFDTLAKESGWRNFEHARFPITRQAVWIENIAEC